MNRHIAIDGPAGAGKSTIAKLIAKQLEYVYVDTGAMYRALAYFFISKNIAPNETEKIISVLPEAKVSIEYIDGSQQVILNGENITAFIRTEAVGNMASVSSAIPEVRVKLVELQQDLAKSINVVMDGRDIGTVVLPDAQTKIFLTASVKTRALRRYKELIEKGQEADIEEIEKGIEERDYRDSHRSASPLKQAEDAVVVDSSEMSIDEVVDAIIRVYLKNNGIYIAESAGFCFGVKRAVSMLESCIKEKEGKIYTLGPIIHNEHVVKAMEDKGVITLRDESALDEIESGTVVIRSHGVSKAVIDKLEERHIDYVDATCPYVKKIHDSVAEKSKEGSQIVVIGDPTHPEVIGIMGWSETPCVVITDYTDIEKLEDYRGKSLSLVVQTTYNLEKFNKIIDIIKNLGYDVKVMNTICNATSKRQGEAKELSLKSEVMLVVGSKSSSNTRKLFDICSECCEKTYYIQSLDDLISIGFQFDSCVGITAGASTPNNIIQEVSKHVRRIKL